MKYREVEAATERIVASTTTQAQALFPKAKPTLVKNEIETWVRKALSEARRLHPRNAAHQMAHTQKRADEAIQKNLADIKGTMH